MCVRARECVGESLSVSACVSECECSHVSVHECEHVSVSACGRECMHACVNELSFLAESTLYLLCRRIVCAATLSAVEGLLLYNNSADLL